MTKGTIIIPPSLEFMRAIFKSHQKFCNQDILNLLYSEELGPGTFVIEN